MLTVNNADDMETTQFKYEVPETREERLHLRNSIATFVKKLQLNPPISMDFLSDLALQLIHKYKLDVGVKGWLMVELNNCVWKDTVASIPHNKRLLLLPKCLSNSTDCKADIDDFGSPCNLCSKRNIHDLQTRG